MEEDGESTQGDRKEGKLTKIWEGDKRRSRVRETQEEAGCAAERV